MLTKEERESAQILGEIAATNAALDVLQQLYLAVQYGGEDVKKRALADAEGVLFFAGRIEGVNGEDIKHGD